MRNRQNRSRLYRRAGGGKALNSRYRSQLEERIANQLIQALGADKLRYESCRITYTRPETFHAYTPDFILPNGIVIEAKGYFPAEDRGKYLNIRRSNPGMDLRFVFSRASTPTRKGAKSTYGDWADRHEFIYAEKHIPPSWYREPINPTALAAIEKGLKL